MGGGHHEPFVVPDYKVYDKYREIPEMVAHEKRLAHVGLKDPWIRNMSFAYDRKLGYTPSKAARFREIVCYGWKGGVAAAIAVIAIEESYLLLKYGYTSWNKPH